MMHVVPASYSQFYLRDAVASEIDAPGLVSAIADTSSLMLVAFRQNGDLPIEVGLVQGPPDLPGREWGDIVEVSFRAGEDPELAGWDPSDQGLSLDLDDGTWYRLRYEIADGDSARTNLDPPYPEKYRLWIWPAEESAGLIVRSETGAGQYWNFQKQAKLARVRAAAVPTGSRTRALVEFALNAHPETARRIAAGETELRAGILAYAQTVYAAEMPYDDIEQLIDECARGEASGDPVPLPELVIPELHDGKRELAVGELEALEMWMGNVEASPLVLKHFVDDVPGYRAQLLAVALALLIPAPMSNGSPELLARREEIKNSTWSTLVKRWLR